MNLLMVDDDKLFLEKLQETVRFKALGIDMVFSAGNIRQAMEILNKYPVDIVLSDIEMPQGSGLELLQWIREKQLCVECIFLSSYAYFAYAQKAIALKSSEYLLKPVSESDLEKALAHAVEKKRESTGEGERKQSREERLWKAVLCGDESAIAGEPEEEAPFWLCLIKCVQMDGGEKQYVTYCVEHFAALEQGEGSALPVPEAVISIKESEWMMLFSGQSVWGEERERAGTIRHRLTEQTKCRFHLFGAGVDKGRGAAKMKTRLEKLAVEAICGRDGVLLLHEWERRREELASPQWEQWEAFTVHVDTIRKANEQIAVYLRMYAAEGRFTVEVLRTFRKELMQMIYNCLKRQNVAMASIFADEEFDRHYEQSVYMLEGMEEFTTYLFDRLYGYNSQDNRQETVVREICNYINSHLKEDITRKQLAALVYLSEDYVSKLFSGTTGMTLPSYITRCRMERAKEYLECTTWSISRVAMENGYSNFSYFSKNFRDYTGMTPNEFREQKKKE